MKTLKYILALASVYTFTAFAQEESKECKEFKMIASDSKMMGDFQEAATYYWKVEKNCVTDNNIYVNLRWCYESMLQTATDETRKQALRDTLITIYALQEAKFGKDPNWSLWHAYYLTANKSTNYTKIDELFSYSIGQLQEKTGASFISTYYYNIMMMFNTEKDLRDLCAAPAYRNMGIAIYRITCTRAEHEYLPAVWVIDEVTI